MRGRRRRGVDWVHIAGCWVAGALLGVLPAVEYVGFQEVLARFLPQSTAVAAFKPQLDDAQRQQVLDRAELDGAVRGSLGGIYIGHHGRQLDGVVYVDHVIGRTEYITYAFVVGPAGRLRDIAVMKYLEPIGDEVRKQDFLDQFLGRDADDPLRLKRGIQNIAGATLSCRGVTERTRFLLHLHRVAVAAQIGDWLAECPALPARPVSSSDGDGDERRAALVGEAVLQIRRRSGAGSLADLLAAAEERDGRWNAWRRDGPLAEAAATGSAVLPPDAQALVGRALAFAAASDGAFDPTVRPLLRLWWQASREGRRPDPAQIDRVRREQVGWQRVALVTGELRLPSAMALDLGGLRKGAQVDAVAADLLAADPTTAALIDYGGSSLRALGSAAWSVTVLDPGGGEEPWLRLSLKAGQALAVSGGARRGWTVGDEQLSTIIDGRSGEPVPLANAACVLAPDATSADAWATIACILSVAELRAAVAAEPDLAMVLRRPDGELRLGAWPSD